MDVRTSFKGLTETNDQRGYGVADDGGVVDLRSLQPLVHVYVVLSDNFGLHVDCSDILDLHLADHFADIVLCSLQNSDERTVASRAVRSE